jgi:hypothetical protein
MNRLSLVGWDTKSAARGPSRLPTVTYCLEIRTQNRALFDINNTV